MLPVGLIIRTSKKHATVVKETRQSVVEGERREGRQYTPAILYIMVYPLLAKGVLYLLIETTSAQPYQ